MQRRKPDAANRCNFLLVADNSKFRLERGTGHDPANVAFEFGRAGILDIVVIADDVDHSIRTQLMCTLLQRQHI